MAAAVIGRTVKQAARHLVTRCGSFRLYSLMRKVSGENVEHLSCESLAERFSAIYTKRVWLNGRQSGSLSGMGSELGSTEWIRLRLPAMLESLGTRVLLDIGCGDFNWMKEVSLPCDYIGVDIVREVVAANASLYGSAGRSFRVLDATRDSLPPADTILCREVLIHLSFDDIWRVVGNARDSGASFLIATSDCEIRLNADIVSGDFRPLNLRRAPFRFPEPFLSLSDNKVAPGRALSAWAVSALPRPRTLAP
jgi:SAM-dependent methyltransferase